MMLYVFLFCLFGGIENDGGGGVIFEERGGDIVVLVLKWKGGGW